MYPTETYRPVCKSAKFFLMFLLLINLIVATGSTSAAMPADTVAVMAKHPESGESSIYQISVVVSKPIPPDAIFRVTFPDEFDLSSLMIVGSTTMNGGFELTVNKQVVTIKRSGLGREVPANEKVDFKFAIVKNPARSADNYKLIVEILDREENTILTKETVQKILPAKK